MRKIFIRRIEELERVLRFGELEQSNLYDGYDTIMELTIDDNNQISISFDPIRVYYRVPQIASERVLFGVYQLITILGNYIPVYDKNNNLLFTKEYYEWIRSKMEGLSHYGSTTYTFSPNLDFPGIEDYTIQLSDSKADSNTKRSAIVNLLKNELAKSGITLGENGTDCDVVLIDTGSTRRGTNLPFDADFDFVARINPAIFDDPIKLNNLKVAMLMVLGGNIDDNLLHGQIREVDCRIPDIGNLKVDITFTSQAKEMEYTTELALDDRLETMKKENPEKYQKVVANIIMAKKFLKAHGVYKPSRRDQEQAGIGGIGLENLIVQNGGSFYDAAKEFLSYAEGKDFIEFEKSYPLFDFGKNHVSVEKRQFPYDNFIMRNMRDIGYQKMCSCLREYVDNYERQMNINDGKKR